MKLTKYSHACFTLESNGQLLVVDPGNASPDFYPKLDMAVVLLTHSHKDHAQPTLIRSIQNLNPNVTIVGPEDIIETLGGNTVAIGSDQDLVFDHFKINAFHLEHDVVHKDSTSKITNIAYFINETVFYGGDTLALPDSISPKVLMLPIAGSWLSTEKIIDTARKFSPVTVIPTHDKNLSDEGKRVFDNHFHNFTSKYNISYRPLDSGESIDIDKI